MQRLMKFCVVVFMLIGVGVSIAEEAAKPISPDVAAVLRKPEEKVAITQMNHMTKRGLELALDTLQRTGGFRPFGMLMKGDSGSDDDYRILAPDDSKGENDVVLTDLLEALRFSVKEEGADYLAAGLVMPFVYEKDGERVQGIRVEVDHPDMKPKVVFVRIGVVEEKLSVGEPQYADGANNIYIEEE